MSPPSTTITTEGPKRRPSPLKTDRMLRSKGDVCRICRNDTSFGQTDHSSVLCAGCGCAFHVSCVGISVNFLVHYVINKRYSWFCYECEISHKDQATATFEAVKKIEAMASGITIEIQKMKCAESGWRQEFEAKITDLIDRKIEDSREEQRLNTCAPPNPSNAVPIVSNYRKNVIITSVPLVSRESESDVIAIVKKIAKQISFLHQNFLDNCFRVKKNIQNEQQNDGTKPPAILVKFTTELARDAFLRNYFHYIRNNPLLASDIDMDSRNRIYVNEHLSPETQSLLKLALVLRKDKRILKLSSHSHYLSVLVAENGRNIWKRAFNQKDLIDFCGPDEASGTSHHH